MNIGRMLDNERQAIASEWTCSYCRHDNIVIYFENRAQIPSASCRCCGSTRESRDTLRITRSDHNALPPRSIDLDSQIVNEWDNMMDNIKQNPKDNECDGADSHIVDSCPKIQKLFLMMKYYHFYDGKKVADSENGDKYRIDSFTDLVENLQFLSLTALVDMFDHVSTVHRTSAMFDHFQTGIGKCVDRADCDIVQRHRCRHQVARNRDDTENVPRSRRKKSKEMQNDENLDALERHTLSFFAKWHSFLFHPTFEDTVADSISTEEEQIGKMNKMDSKPVLDVSRLISRKYVDYGFGVWIDYTAHSPSFESMKEEMMGNGICSITLDQWQRTLMNALTHFDSDKIQEDGRWAAKRSDEKFGIEVGQEIGIENVVAILIYCNYTELQARFSETFRRMQDDETDEMIVDRHCRNYYWLGRCVRFTSMGLTTINTLTNWSHPGPPRFWICICAS